MNPIQFTNLLPPPTLSTKIVRLSENSSNKVIRNTLVNVVGLVLTNRNPSQRSRQDFSLSGNKKGPGVGHPGAGM